MQIAIKDWTALTSLVGHGFSFAHWVRGKQNLVIGGFANSSSPVIEIVAGFATQL